MLTFAAIWVLILLPLPWLVQTFVPARRTSVLSVRVPFGDRLRAAGQSGSTVRQVTRTASSVLLPWSVWVLVLLALARPQWIEPPVSRELPTRDLLLLVDLSGSMQQQDFTSATGEQVDRLTAVKEVLGEFLSKRDGDRVGLVVFGDAPFLQAPFSTDLQLSRQLLNETDIGMAGPKTAFGDAIGLGVSLFQKSEAPAKTIIALTDGNDTKSQVPPVEASRIARQEGIRIHTVAIGDPTTVGEEKLDAETLRRVAEGTSGRYFFAGDREELNGIYEELDSIETRKVDVVSYRPKTDLFYWCLLAALLITMGEKLAIVLAGRRQSKLRHEGTVHVDPVTGRLEVRA